MTTLLVAVATSVGGEEHMGGVGLTLYLGVSAKICVSMKMIGLAGILTCPSVPELVEPEERGFEMLSDRVELAADQTKG